MRSGHRVQAQHFTADNLTPIRCASLAQEQGGEVSVQAYIRRPEGKVGYGGDSLFLAETPGLLDV